MADIFISYKKEDAGRVIRIVEALRAEGFSVWWDHGITPGAQWDQTIHDELKAAKAVIAIWSKESVTAPWVKEEASVGKNRGILLPIRIDDVEPPLGFSLIQMGDLVGWNGDAKDSHWQLVLGALRAIIRGERPQGLEAAPRRRTNWVLVAGALALIALGAAAFWYATRSAPQQTASEHTPAAVQAPQAQPSTPAAAPASGEQAAWDNAMQQRTREAFQSFLIAYPNGAYARRARDVLLTCRTQMSEVWQPGRSGQMIRGVNTELAASEAQGCRLARASAQETAERSCRAIASNEGYRNGQVTMVDGPCTCRQTPGGYTCLADPSYSCTWEQRTQQQVEICG